MTTRHAGFTLLELMVVLVLLAVASGLVLPGIRQDLLGDRLSGTARRIAGMVSSASAAARRAHAPVLLVFDMEQGTVSYRPPPGASGEKPGRGEELLLPEDLRVSVRTLHGGEAEGGRAELRFTPRGYTDETVIVLRDEEDEALSVTVSPFVGVVRIREGEAGFRQ